MRGADVNVTEPTVKLSSSHTPNKVIVVEQRVETEANVYEPFDEYVKQVEMKPLDDTSAEVEMNVDGLVNSSTSRFIYNGVKTRCLSK